MNSNIPDGPPASRVWRGSRRVPELGRRVIHCSVHSVQHFHPFELQLLRSLARCQPVFVSAHKILQLPLDIQT